MVGMNFNGMVQGNELRLVAQEIFKKAQAQPKSAEAEASIIKQNPFSGASKKLEFTPEETENAKAGFAQSIVSIDPETQKSVKALAAIDKYSKLAFNSQSELGQEGALALPMPEFMAGAGAVSDEQGKKNPLLALLLILLGGKKEGAEGGLEEDAMKVMFAAATATKK